MHLEPQTGTGGPLPAQAAPQRAIVGSNSLGLQGAQARGGEISSSRVLAVGSKVKHNHSPRLPNRSHGVAPEAWVEH